MAKIHKVTLYVVDIGGDSDIEDAIDYGLNEYDLYSKALNIDSSNDFEWNDELIINKSNCTERDIEKYFDK